MKIHFSSIAVVGAGAMGQGIAQIAAQAGSHVWLLDSKPGAADKAKQAIQQQWAKLAAKGRVTEEQVQAWSQQLQIANTLADLGSCQLVIEAVVERLEVKQALFAELERTLPANVVWATNTSSLSVTAIAAALQQPERLAGFHFFNPVPLMKVVEVVAGLKTDPALCQALTAYAREMGHTPYRRKTRRASSSTTPGVVLAPRHCASSARAWPTSPPLTASCATRWVSSSDPSS